MFIVTTWIPSGSEVLQIVFYNVKSFFELVDENNDNYAAHLTSFMV